MIENTGNQINSGVKQGDGSPSSTVRGTMPEDGKRSATMAYLAQVEEITREIKLKKSKIAIMRDALSVRSPTFSDMPKAPSPNLQPMAERICDILALEDEVRDMEMEAAGLKANMMTMFERLKNQDEELVLIECYLNLKSVGKACKALHFSRGWYMKVKARAINHLEQVLVQEGELEKWIR